MYNLNSYKSWRNMVIPQIKLPSDAEIYEFGVYSGHSVLEFLDGFQNSFHRIYGFDSFMGLPKNDLEPAWQAEWVEGGYDSRQLTKCNTPEESSALIEKAINNPKYIPIIGFYEDTLKDSLIQEKGLKPASIIDIDVDLYSSTVTVLDFMFRNKLYKTGTLVFYDDWGGSVGWETNSSGESKAHKELTEKYGVVMQEVFSVGNAFPHVQKIFVIK